MAPDARVAYDRPMTTTEVGYFSPADYKVEDIELVPYEMGRLEWTAIHVPSGEELCLSRGRKGRNKAIRQIRSGACAESMAFHRSDRVLSYLRSTVLYIPLTEAEAAKVVAVGRPMRGFYFPPREQP